MKTDVAAYWTRLSREGKSLSVYCRKNQSFTPRALLAAWRLHMCFTCIITGVIRLQQGFQYCNLTYLGDPGGGLLHAGLIEHGGDGVVVDVAPPPVEGALLPLGCPVHDVYIPEGLRNMSPHLPAGRSSELCTALSMCSCYVPPTRGKTVCMAACRHDDVVGDEQQQLRAIPQ